MPITNSKLQIMNNALRLVGSYHLESNDTTSTTYEIADRAFDQAVLEIFSNNVFQYNTRRILRTAPQTVTDTSTLTTAQKPSSRWPYRVNLSFAGPSPNLRYVTILDVTNEDGSVRLEWVFDNTTAETSPYEDVPYLFTTEDRVQIHYSFVPQSDASGIGFVPGNDIYYMPPHLANLVSYLMASNMAIELSGSEQRSDLLYQRYVAALRRVRVMEGRSSPAQQYIHDDNSSFVTAIKNYGKV